MSLRHAKRKDKVINYPNVKVKTFCYLKDIITNPNIIVGDYSYYDDNENGPESFEKHVTHFYPFIGDKLIIGKFVCIAKGVEFIMNGANHMMDCLTSYPFEIIDEFKGLTRPFKNRANRGNTVIGNDVWIGQNVTILPGIHIGDGAIIGANSTVGKDIPPYSIAVGNPVVIKRYRFDKETIKLLLKLQWWNLSKKELIKVLPMLTNDIKKTKSELAKYIKNNK